MNRYLSWSWVGVGFACASGAWAEPSVEAGLADTAETAPRVAWVELLTSARPEDLAPFYGRVFGWTAEVCGDGRLASVCLANRGRPVGGISYRADARVGLPKARWLGFLAVADLASASTTITAAGGKVLVAQRPWSGHGRQAVLVDAEGALLGLVQSGDGADAGALAPDGVTAREWASEAIGQWLWPVLLTKEPKAAAVFYGTLVGGASSEDERTPMFAGDFLITRGSGPRAARAGVVALPRRPSGLPGWLWSVRVADLDATVRVVLKEGGKILRRPGMDLMGGRMAVVSDPWGAVFGLVEPTGSVKVPVTGEIATAVPPAMTRGAEQGSGGGQENREYRWHDPSFFSPWYDGTAFILPPPPAGMVVSGVRAVPAAHSAPEVKELVY